MCDILKAVGGIKLMYKTKVVYMQSVVGRGTLFPAPGNKQSVVGGGTLFTAPGNKQSVVGRPISHAPLMIPNKTEL